MLLSLIRKNRARTIMQDTLAEGFQEMCEEVNAQARELAEKFSNGAGDRLRDATRGAAR